MKKEICLESLVSYKERSPYGDAYWRGMDFPKNIGH